MENKVEAIKAKQESGEKLNFAERNILKINERKSIQKARNDAFERIKQLSADKNQKMAMYSGIVNAEISR